MMGFPKAAGRDRQKWVRICPSAGVVRAGVSSGWVAATGR
jgi:hypothetical protein